MATRVPQQGGAPRATPPTAARGHGTVAGPPPLRYRALEAARGWRGGAAHRNHGDTTMAPQAGQQDSKHGGSGEGQSVEGSPHGWQQGRIRFLAPHGTMAPCRATPRAHREIQEGRN
eukprot:8261198-Pyramimonas_sp.AAC.1